jgi:hypothetical protein
LPEKRRARPVIPRPSAVTPPISNPKTFVVTQVRQALQQTGAAGPYSANRVVTGTAFSESLRSTKAVYVCRGLLPNRPGFLTSVLILAHNLEGSDTKEEQTWVGV